MAATDRALTIVVIGPKNAGKTVFLSALANSPGISSGDAATVRAIKLHWQALVKGENPPATAATLADMFFTFNGRCGEREYSLNLRLPDYDGHFAEIFSEHESGAKEIERLRELVRNADGFIVLMPADPADSQIMEKMRVEIGAFIDAASSRHGPKILKPLVIAANKWDKSPFFRSAGEDLEAKTFIESIGIYHDIYKKLQNYFSDITIIPLSAYGHPPEDGKPGSTGIAPYRVEDPVAAIIEKLFASLARQTETLEAAGDWFAVAALLLRAKALWAQQPDGAFAALLQTALAHCHKNLAQELSAAKNAAAYDSIWQNSAAAAFWDEFSPVQRGEIEGIRREKLAATSGDLAQKLSQSRDREEYEDILQNSPEGKYFADFGKEQQSGILKIADRHKRSEKRRQIFRNSRRIITLAFFIAAAFWVWRHTEFSRGFAEAMDPSKDPGSQWHALAKFITRYEASPLTAWLYGDRLEEAARKRASLVRSVADDITARLAQAERQTDACARAVLAERLLEEANSPGLNAPRGLINNIDMLHEQSSRICQARGRIESARTPADLEAGEKMLEQLPALPEINRLRELARTRHSEAAQAEAASPEKARAAAIQEEFARIGREGNLDDAENFINSYKDDPAEEARRLARDMAAGMGSRLYHSLLSLVRQIKTFGDDELGTLREMTARQHRYPLDDAQRRTVGAELQKAAEKHDQTLIASIPEKIAGSDELEAAEAMLKTAASLPSVLKFDNNSFRYRRPESLEYALATRMQAIAACRKMLADGLEAANLEVAARADNPLKLHGRSPGSAFTRNSELTVRFPGDPDEISWRNSPMNDHEEEDGKIYSISLGPLRLRPAAGEVHLREENFGSADLGCSSPFSINADDLFGLLNQGVLRKELSGSCKGISLIFHRY